jgi:hypothetical protein
VVVDARGQMPSSPYAFSSIFVKKVLWLHLVPSAKASSLVTLVASTFDSVLSLADALILSH